MPSFARGEHHAMAGKDRCAVVGRNDVLVNAVLLHAGNQVLDLVVGVVLVVFRVALQIVDLGGLPEALGDLATVCRARRGGLGRGGFGFGLGLGLGSLLRRLP